MSLLQRRITLIDFLRTGEVFEHRIEFGGIEFLISAHRIGWDFETAQAILKSQDGFADGFAISGIQKVSNFGGRGQSPVPHPGYLRLLRSVQKTPLYLADELRELFAEWSLQKVIQSEPHLLAGRTLLFQCAAVTPALGRFEQAGVRLQAADALIFGGPMAGLVQRPLEGRPQIESFFKLAYPLHRLRSIQGLRPSQKILSPQRARAFHQWLGKADGLVTFGSLIEQGISHELLAALDSKLLIVDYLSPEVRERLEASNVGQILELTPQLPGLEALPIKHFSILTAILDQCRQAEGDPRSFSEYVLQAIQDRQVRPARFARTHRKLPVRCAFVIHPLTEGDLFRHPALSWLSGAPEFVRRAASHAASRTPGFHYGSIRGAVSQATSQEVICDIYGLPMTPSQILSTPEDRLYDQLTAIARMAHKRGASILGLGAYTKVAGDAGLTVARHSPIPVTNGNSYSASTTLWAARIMAEKMGLAQKSTRKVMVIGATGSIGRVSALLISLATDGVTGELVLVAQRADKLLELRDEIARLSPGTKIKVTTQPNSELADTDLIITATSNLRGQILDMDRVKPGAVICDCSRPLDISAQMAARRPDVMVIQSGEVELPGTVSMDCDIGLPQPSVYACLAETVLLAMEGRFESFSLSKTLSIEKVKEVYRLGIRHGARLSAIQGYVDGHETVVTDEAIARCRELALAKISASTAAQSLTGPKAGRKSVTDAGRPDQTLLRW